MIKCVVMSFEKTNIYEGARSVSLPAYLGRLQILSGHAEAFFLLREGDIVIRKQNGEKKILRAPDGVCHFKNNNLIIIS